MTPLKTLEYLIFAEFGCGIFLGFSVAFSGSLDISDVRFLFSMILINFGVGQIIGLQERRACRYGVIAILFGAFQMLFGSLVGGNVFIVAGTLGCIALILGTGLAIAGLAHQFQDAGR